MFKPLFSALFCSFLNTAHLPCGLDCLKQEHMRRSCCWNAPTPRAELKAQRCLFCLLQVLQGVSQSQANPLLIYVSQRHQAMPSKSLISKSPFILHLSSEISTTQLQQICFVPTKCYFSELNFWRAAVWALPSLLATFKQAAMPGIHLLWSISASEKGELKAGTTDSTSSVLISSQKFWPPVPGTVIPHLQLQANPPWNAWWKVSGIWAELII